MLSAIVFASRNFPPHGAFDPAVLLGRSLNALVEAAVAGVLADVTIAGPFGCGLSFLADHAGCGCVERNEEAEWLHDALALVKGQQCLIVRAGYIPGPGFIEALRNFLLNPQTHAAFLRAEPENWGTRLFPLLAPIAAAAAPVKSWRAQPKADFSHMVRGLRGRTLLTKMHPTG